MEPAGTTGKTSQRKESSHAIARLRPFPLASRAVRLGSAGLAATLVLGGSRSVAAADQPSLEANKAVARRVFEEGFNHRNLAVLQAAYAPDFVDYGSWARQMPGPAGMPITSDAFHTLFPDVFATVEDAIAEENLVAARVTWHGTHPPAGTHVVGRTMHLLQMVNGQIVAQWSTGWDWLGSLQRVAEKLCHSEPARNLGSLAYCTRLQTTTLLLRRNSTKCATRSKQQAKSETNESTPGHVI